jgi:uncharacterized protein (DUF3084 family)
LKPFTPEELAYKKKLVGELQEEKKKRDALNAEKGGLAEEIASLQKKLAERMAAFQAKDMEVKDKVKEISDIVFKIMAVNKNRIVEKEGEKEEDEEEKVEEPAAEAGGEMEL